MSTEKELKFHLEGNSDYSQNFTRGEAISASWNGFFKGRALYSSIFWWVIYYTHMANLIPK